MVGGFDFDKSKFNHVTQAWRQPGSSFKPFIYSAALEKGFTPLTVINDAPLFFDATATGSQPWEPKNYDGKFEGPMPLRQALAKSKNMVSIRILQAIGPTYAQDWITRFGFEADKHPAFLTMALGAGHGDAAADGRPPTACLPTAAIASIRCWWRASPIPRGRVLQETKPQVLDPSMRTHRRAQRVHDDPVAARGDAQRHRSQGRSTQSGPDIAGKTGTTNRLAGRLVRGLSTRSGGRGLDRLRHAAQARRPRDRRRLGIAGVDGVHGAQRCAPFRRARCHRPKAWRCTAATGCTKSLARGAGVTSLGMEDQLPPQAPSEDERKGILDLFKR